jgi:hypothetical protein
MTPNPFIYLATDPLAFFALLGYGLGLVALTLLATAYCSRMAGFLVTRYRATRHQDQWLDGPAGIGTIPPAGWTLRAASIPFVLMLEAWAVGALVWILAGG